MNLKGLTKKQRANLRSWLRRDVDLEHGERMRALLEASIGRIAANRVREVNARDQEEGRPISGEREYLALAMVRPSVQDHQHILDWLRASLLSDAAWLENSDECGRPRKLMKCSTYADLVREADKAMDRLNAQDAKSLGPDDEAPVADLAEGFRLVRLLTPHALDLESRRMHHCVGHGSYDDGVESGAIEIYSLRDPQGRPFVTIEVDVDTVRLDSNNVLSNEPRTYRDISQMQGRHNADPDPAHLAILKPFVREAGWGGRQDYWPSVTDVDGVEHDVDAIPEGTVLDTLDAKWDQDVELPAGLTVRGDAYFGSCISRLPERLTVGGDVSCFCATRPGPLVFPDSMQVGGAIKVWNEGDVVLPEHLRERVVIQKSINISDIKKLWDRCTEGEGVNVADYTVEMTTTWMSPEFAAMMRNRMLAEVAHAWDPLFYGDDTTDEEPAVTPR